MENNLGRTSFKNYRQLAENTVEWHVVVWEVKGKKPTVPLMMMMIVFSSKLGWFQPC
jgi:hypothetical protein